MLDIVFLALWRFSSTQQLWYHNMQFMVSHQNVSEISEHTSSLSIVTALFTNFTYHHKTLAKLSTLQVAVCMLCIYDNEYTSIIDIYFYETFSIRTSSISILKTFLDTLSDILDKCLCFSLIKIEPVLIFSSQAKLGPILSSVVYTFQLKMLS
jgi:hypothetical protein